MNKIIITLLSLSMTSGTALAKKPRHKYKNIFKHERADKDGKHGAAKEELILDQKDTHGTGIEAGKDKRPTSIHAFHKYTYSRIKSLLTNGKLTEAQGTIFKTQHTNITKAISEAKSDGTMTTDEIKSIRSSLDKLNDDINAIVGKIETRAERTPLLNRQQHRIEEAIEAGQRSGRLSTLEANGLKRKLNRLTNLEAKLKKDDAITTKEREKLFKQMAELKRDLKDALLD